MEDVLTIKFYEFIRENNPDKFMVLQDAGTLTDYINDAVASMSALIKQRQAKGEADYIIEEICLAAMTANLRPSKYHYINNILEEEFETKWLEFNNNGLLQFELINLINTCESVFEEMGFTEDNENNNQLRYAIMGNVAAYLETH